MWTLFKILNTITVFASAYMWFTAPLPLGPLMLLLNIGMALCLGFLPLKPQLDLRTEVSAFFLLALVLWTLINETLIMGIVVLSVYTPVFYLTFLPREYQADLLKFVTKWLAIILIPGLMIYWILLAVPLPNFGSFVFPPYVPFNNYIFFIQTTYDYGTLVRFNSIFPEPGHLAMVCEFILLANNFNFKKQPWLWVILTAVVFSFSLAGYIITFTAFSLLKVNTWAKGILASIFLGVFVFAALNYAGGDNALNQLIIERLKYDESKGIQGNNRYFNNTDYEFDKAMKTGDYWAGVSGKANMDLIGGAGFKIYTLQHGLIAVFIVLGFYLSLIPQRPNWHYTLVYIFIVALCFAQNAYPGWYAWLFPYVLGLNLNSKHEPSD